MSIEFADDERQDDRAINLSHEQREVLAALLDGVEEGKEQQTLGGYAGTGKTTLIAELADTVDYACVVAPTGRAASVLRRKGIPASTIHSLSYKPVPECEGKCFKDEVDCHCKIIGWSRNEMLPYDLIVCDEASMVPRKVYFDLTSYGVPTIFVADHGQLPPIQKQGEEPFNLMAAPEHRLEHIHRNAGEIARFAHHLRNGGLAFQFQPRNNSVQIAGKEESLERLPVMHSDRIICAMDRTRVAINAYYRRRTGRNGLVVSGETVICLKNDRDRGLNNGTLAKVLSVSRATFDIDSEEGKFSGVEYEPSQFGNPQPPEFRFGNGRLLFDYGYASTCHKAQGGEWPRVLVIEQYLGDRLGTPEMGLHRSVTRPEDPDMEGLYQDLQPIVSSCGGTTPLDAREAARLASDGLSFNHITSSRKVYTYVRFRSEQPSEAA
jgi:exodeoxyribonuclease-5